MRATLAVTSPVFAEGGPIPRRYTCQGIGAFPELWWSDPPEATQTLALVVSDPDAPRGTFLHWVLYDLDPHRRALTSSAAPGEAREAQNSARQSEWFAPCPPRGVHRYVFTLYALPSPAAGRTTKDLLTEFDAQAIAVGSLTGTVAAGG